MKEVIKSGVRGTQSCEVLEEVGSFLMYGRGTKGRDKTELMFPEFSLPQVIK